MSFYKPGSNHPTDPSVAKLHVAIWALIYGGLITAVLGLSVARANSTVGWLMVAGGALLTVVGAVLIYVRSKIKL